MKSILFSIGPVHVFSFGAMIALGVIAFLYFGVRRAKQDGFPKVNDVYDLAFMVLITGILGARLYYTIQYWDWYLKHPLQILAFWEGGLTFYGGVIGAFLGAAAYFKIKNIPIRKGFDFILPLVALGHAFGRIGCFLNGCCGGRVCHTHEPWCIKFPDSVDAVYPTQLYEMAFNFSLFLFLWILYKKKQFNGQIMALYFMLYTVGRFAIEFWRDNAGWMGLSHNQWFSLGLFFIALFFYFRWQKASSQIPTHVKSGNRRSGK